MVVLYNYFAAICILVKAFESNLIVADALSRAFVCNDNDDDCEQRPRIMNVNAFDNFPDARLLEVKNATEKDANLQSVTELILIGIQCHI
jgi:hypothetical protein